MHEGQQAGRRGGKSKVTVTTRQVGRRSCGANVAVRRGELGGASMQPSMTVLQEVTRVCQTCFSGTCAWAKEGLTREHEDLEVRGGFGIANPFGSIILSQESTTSSSTFLSSIAKQDHKLPRRLLLRPSSTRGKHARQTPFVIHGISSSSSFSLRRSYRHGTSLSVCSSP
jgi:hypothetical protein